ncbi:MAG: JAB domain-containing protein [Blautia obeum]|nr:JAB domain-containing protein [Blautia obeum]
MRTVPEFHRVEPRLRLEHFPPVPYVISNARDAVEFVYDNVLKESFTEQFVCIYLDVKCRPVCYCVLARGDESSVYVNFKEVITPAILYGVSRIICVHNHPSGCNTPSRQDRNFSYNLYDCCKRMGLVLVDSIVCGCCSEEEKRYSSISKEDDPENPWEIKRQETKKREEFERKLLEERESITNS